MADPVPAPFGPEMAASYDQRFAGLAPLREALHLVTRFALAPLPERARILVVGAGTGLEIEMLGRHYPEWRFVAVDPSGPMLDQLRAKGLPRCELHQGFLDSLPETEPFDGATSLLVSHFVLDVDQRREFFREIARRLAAGGLLLSADVADPGSQPLRQLWMRLQAHSGGTTLQAMEEHWATQATKVAFLPPEQVEGLIASAGFEPPARVYQGALIHAWVARRP